MKEPRVEGVVFTLAPSQDLRDVANGHFNMLTKATENVPGEIQIDRDIARRILRERS